MLGEGITLKTLINYGRFRGTFLPGVMINRTLVSL